jgi:hypothetical protein
VAASYARHITLAAGVVQSFTLPGDYSSVEVLNRAGSDEIYTSYDGTATPANPTTGGNDCDVVTAATGASIQISRNNSVAITVKLISAAGTTASLRGIL